MGRHSAPDDTDEDVLDAGPSTAVVTDPATGPDGRHAYRTASRPRPALAVDAAGHDAGSEDDAPPPVEGLSLLDDAFGPEREREPEPAAGAAEARTVTIPLAEIARDDRAVPEETTARIGPVVADPPDDRTPTPAPTPPARGAHATSADLALIRAHGDVRARVIAAVLAPFVVFVAVFAVRGDLDVHSLVWLWIPAVVAGVLVGALLDAGHKRYADEPER